VRLEPVPERLLAFLRAPDPADRTRPTDVDPVRFAQLRAADEGGVVEEEVLEPAEAGDERLELRVPDVARRQVEQLKPGERTRQTAEEAGDLALRDTETEGGGVLHVGGTDEGGDRVESEEDDRLCKALGGGDDGVHWVLDDRHDG